MRVESKSKMGLIVLFLSSFVSVAQANSVGGAGYIIGRDNLATLASGTFTGSANPNYGRLTFLYNHDNHYHGLGTYSYTGTAQAPVANDTNANNRSPEISSLQAPLPLSMGSGSLYGDKLVNKISGLEYSDMRFLSVDSLAAAPAGSPEAILFNSSNGRWNQSIAGSQVQLELVSATPGLYIGDSNNLNLFQSSNLYNLGAGEAIDFTPVFWTAINAPLGKYSAEFRLIGSNGLNDSGRFSIDVAPVPLPTAVWLFGSGLMAFLGMSKRKKLAA